MITNESLEWTALEEHVKNAFQTVISYPEKVLLEPGLRLYKYSDFDTAIIPNREFISEWWSPLDDYKYATSLQQKLKFCESIRVSIQEYTRVTSAVSEDWNSLRFLLVVEVVEPIYGFFGGFASQNRVNDPEQSRLIADIEERAPNSRRLPGGGHQFYVPNFRQEFVKQLALTEEDISNRRY